MVGFWYLWGVVIIFGVEGSEEVLLVILDWSFVRVVVEEWARLGRSYKYGGLIVVRDMV